MFRNNKKDKLTVNVFHTNFEQVIADWEKLFS